MSSHMSFSSWIARDAVPFSLSDPRTAWPAIDRMIAALGDSVQILGFGEPLHGGEEFLQFRNLLFERLAEAHGYSAIVIESSYPMARRMNEYVSGAGPDSYEAVQAAGFGYTLGRLAANRELVERMRKRNADSEPGTKLQFYGFDMPTSPIGIASPKPVLMFAVNYLASLDHAKGEEHRQRIDGLLGPDSDWENPEIYTDPSKSPGLSSNAGALRLATEDLITELRVRGPELADKSNGLDFAEALHYAVMARQLLNFHAAMAGGAGYAATLAIRDALMADNLTHILNRERERGKVLVFAQHSHLKRGPVVVWPSWQKALGADSFSWWPAGAHISQWLGLRYAVIGAALGESEENGIGPPEPGTLEALLTATPGLARLIPTHAGRHLPAEELAALPVRAGSATCLSYTPLSPQSLTDFDWLMVLDSCSYYRGGPPKQ